MVSIKDQITMIKKVLVDFTDECFNVRLENDDAGTHITIYIAEDKDLYELRKSLQLLDLTKHCVIVIANKDYVASRSD